MTKRKSTYIPLAKCFPTLTPVKVDTLSEAEN
jgi:hypothetical protein